MVYTQPNEARERVRLRNGGDTIAMWAAYPASAYDVLHASLMMKGLIIKHLKNVTRISL